MDPNQAQSDLLAAVRVIRAQQDGEELSVDRYIDEVDAVCDSVLALDDWLRKRGFLPKPWARAGREAELEKACRGLLQDIGEVLERQGEQWWEDTVTSGLHHRTLAQRCLGEDER